MLNITNIVIEDIFKSNSIQEKKQKIEQIMLLIIKKSETKEINQ